MLNQMRGIVIAGGFGTRLRPLTLSRPKPLMPLVNAPLLEYQLGYLKQAGITEVCFATNFMADAVEAEFGNGSRFGMSLTYAVEKEPLDTAGAIRNGYDAISGDDCVVFNGDTIHGFDIGAIVRQHNDRNAHVTLTLKRVERPHPYGVVPLNAEGRVQGFLEPSEEQKRKLSDEASGWDAINAGLYVMSKEAIETIPLKRCNVEREVFPKLIEEGWSVFGDVQDAYWVDIGRPSQYLEATRAVVFGEVGAARQLCLSGEAHIEPGAVTEGCELKGGVSIGSGVKIGKGTTLDNSVILSGAVIGENCHIARSIISEHCKIGANTTIRDTALAEGSQIPAYSVLGSIA